MVTISHIHGRHRVGEQTSASRRPAGPPRIGSLLNVENLHSSAIFWKHVRALTRFFKYCRDDDARGGVSLFFILLSQPSDRDLRNSSPGASRVVKVVRVDFKSSGTTGERERGEIHGYISRQLLCLRSSPSTATSNRSQLLMSRSSRGSSLVFKRYKSPARVIEQPAV